MPEIPGTHWACGQCGEENRLTRFARMGCRKQRSGKDEVLKHFTLEERGESFEAAASNTPARASSTHRLVQLTQKGPPHSFTPASAGPDLPDLAAAQLVVIVVVVIENEEILYAQEGSQPVTARRLVLPDAFVQHSLPSAPVPRSSSKEQCRASWQN